MRLLIYTGWPVKAWRIPDEQVARIRATLPDVDVLHATSADQAVRDIADADIGLIPWLTTPILSGATRLRWVHSSAAAVGDLLPLAELARRAIIVTNSRGVQAIPMAEHVMAGLLGLARRLVNVGRAQLVDTRAMVQALESGQLAGAVLDVFDSEPLDAESPLWSMPNVIVTPHSAGFRADHWQHVTDLFIENVGRFRRGESLRNVVDPVAGY
jgi:phosphoglycerate dehydrogenase-like enzyme